MRSSFARTRTPIRRAVAVVTTAVTLTALFGGSAVAAPAPVRAAPASDAPTSGSDPHADIQEQLDTMVARGEPGVAFLATREHRTWTATSGVGDLDTRTPMPRDGQFRAASLTKTMVATVVLQLVEERRLDLSDTLEERLPGLVPDGDRITVAQLLDHTSGLADYASTPTFADPREYAGRTYSPRALVEVAVAAGPVDAPGAAFHYSNTGYVLLGMIVEKLTGRDLPQVLRTRIFHPAGMTASYLPTTFPRLTRPHASGYVKAGELVEITELNPSFAWAAYGVVSTATDLQRFYRSLFRGRLLPAAAVARMRTDVVETGNPIWPSYGYGLEKMTTTCGVELWGHTGSIPGYENVTFSTTDGRRQVTVMMNAHVTDPSSGPMKIGAVNAVNLEFCGVPFTL